MKNNYNWTILDYNRPYGYNLGDYIQTLAVVNNLIKNNINNNMLFFNRSNLKNFNINCCNKYKNNVIMQGWFDNNMDFIPNKLLQPLYIGFCLYDKLPIFDIKELHPVNNTKIGCRDLYTLQRVGEDKGYFSRCLTLTFDKRNENDEKNDDVIIVTHRYNSYSKNIDYDIYKQLLKFNFKNIKHIDHADLNFIKNNCTDNLGIANNILNIYKKAKLVVTPLLHVACPCIAMGTPVVFIDTLAGVRRTTLAGIIPSISFDDIKKIDFNNIPVINIEELKNKIKLNFSLSLKQAYWPEEFTKDDEIQLQNAREFIKLFISNEYYNFL